MNARLPILPHAVPLTAALLAATLAVLAPAAPAAADEEGIFPFPPVVRDLENGLRAVLIETPYPDIVALHITVLAGSRDEVEPGKSGFAHFFEHMMFRGTETYPPERYNEILKKAGADQNAYTTDDYTNYHVTFTKDDLEKVLELEADRFQSLSYSLDQFQTEARAVLGEYNKNYADPIRKLMEFQREKVFTKHTYEHTTMGFLEDIEDMPNEYEYSLDFYRRFYRPERTVVTVVGDIDVDRTFGWIEEHFGDWEPGAADPDIRPEPRQQGPITGHVDWDSPTLPWVVVGFRGPAFSARKNDMASMDLLSNLYFSPSSEVYQELVIEERKVDQFFPYFPDRKDPYLVSVFARVTDPEHAESVRDAILDTFARARTERVDESRMERVKANLKYSFVGGLDSSEAIADVFARYIHFERDPGTIDAVYAMYDTLTPDDLLTAARRYFVDSQAHVFTLSAEPLPGSWDRVPSVETGATAGDDAPEIKTLTLRNESPLVNLRFVFATGAAGDPDGKEGLAQLTASMITDAGSRALTTQEISERMFPLAAGFGNQVDKEMTVLGGVVHRDNLDEYYAIIRDQLLTPGWRGEDFERVKQNLVNQIRVSLVGNNDEELGKEVLYEEIYRGHPYGHLSLGHTRALEGLTLDDCREFYVSHYTRESALVGLAGGFDEAFVARVRRDLARLPEAPETASGGTAGGNGGWSAEPALPAVPPIDGWKMTIVKKNTRATGLHWGFPIEVNRSHPDFTALWLARSWLGEHRSSNSHLFQRIREVRGMNYGDYAYIEYFPAGMFQFQPDPNLARREQIFQVWIRPVVPANAPFALRISLHEFEKLIENGLTEEQFEATRDFLSKYVSLLLKTQDRQLGYAIDSRFYGIGPFAEKIKRDLAGLTAPKVNAAIRRHFQMENVQFVAVAPNAEELRDLLVSNAPSTMEYDGEKPEELLREDAVIHRYPLRFEAQDVRIVEAGDVFVK